ncbi:MAG: lysophospholipase [Bacteroidota bacterium]|nr:lysophospholipase [Bacteroidota bacterium]
MNQQDTQKKLRRKIFQWTKIIILIYCSAGIALYYLQEKLMFHPIALPPDYQFKFDIPFEEINIALNEKDNLSLVKFFPPDSIPKGVVVYFHGNRGNVIRYSKYAGNFTKHGYEVWIVDYPGYGKTTGKFTEQKVYMQAMEIYKLAKVKFDSNDIIVYGKSLGSGIASWLVSKKSCKRLILETPYFSIPDLFASYAPIYPVDAMTHFKFPTGEYLTNVKAPITIFHGSDDHVIPMSCAAKLKKVLKPGDEFVTIDKGSHNDLNEFPLFHEKLDSVLSL